MRRLGHDTPHQASPRGTQRILRARVWPLALTSCLLLVSLLLSTSSASAENRWVWVKGKHQRGECDERRAELEGALTQHLIELTRAELVYDGQALSCESADCARARLTSAGGVMALLGASSCRRGTLSYTVKVISRVTSRSPLVYRRSLSPKSKESASEAGYQLARRVLSGPRLPKSQALTAPRQLWSVTLGLVWAQLMEEGAPASAISLSRMQRFERESPLALRLGLSGTRLITEELEMSEFTFDTSIGWMSHPTGVSLWLSGGVSLAYFMRAQVKRVVEPIDAQQTFWAHRRELEEVDGLSLAPWLESGLIWSTGRLQPLLTLRYTPLRLSQDQSWADLSVRFGFRWR